MVDFKTVLILAPHPDDAELGCGGTISRLIEYGADVYPVVFSEANGRQEEMIKATEILGMKECIEYELPIRQLSYFRQNILDGLITIKEELNPDLIIQPTLNDIHQDHQVIAQEGIRAFKDRTVWGYEVPWNNLTLDAQLFVGLQDRHVEKKIEAVKCYKSQSHKAYISEEYIRGLMTVRGVQVGVKYAEMFNVIREVIL